MNGGRTPSEIEHAAKEAAQGLPLTCNEGRNEAEVFASIGRMLKKRLDVIVEKKKMMKRGVLPGKKKKMSRLKY